MYRPTVLHTVITALLIMVFSTVPLYGKDDKIVTPKEFGTYIQTTGGLKRIVPNIVQDQNGMLFVESNKPAVYALKDFEYFVLYGPQNMEVLTLNPLLFLQASPLGKPQYMFGKNIEFTTQKKGNNLYTVKPKGLMGRGYFCLWIEDAAWDFVIE
ncbi:MAG: hypothetical protein LBQ00_01265 [Syntrophobacterales bacterium]|jgi:hypothetical protein|nr:hypothetical protein [Syntrophobacterales bacterium]